MHQITLDPLLVERYLNIYKAVLLTAYLLKYGWPIMQEGLKASMKRMIGLLLTVCLFFSAESALAAKARSIESDADSIHHSSHMHLHVGNTGCHATGNYIKTRTKANGNKVIGHLEQADEFILLEMTTGWARIEVTYSDRTSPDSWVGMTGWVNADYIDCDCAPSDYANTMDKSTGVYPAFLPSAWTFSSGAGAWSTELHINPDGSFYGYYNDFNSSEEYESFFNGTFSNIQKCDSHSYSMVVADLTVNGVVGFQYRQGDALHTITEPYGIAKGDVWNVFLPGANQSLLSREHLSWLHGVITDPLGSYALCNMTSGYAFEPCSELPDSIVSHFEIENNYRCKVNDLRVRKTPDGKIIGHIDRGDRFVVTAVVDGWAHIWVEYSDRTSADSWVGLSGWVSMKYLEKQSDGSPNEQWKKAYREYLFDNNIMEYYDEYAEYWFAYIDDDSIPELIIDTTIVAGGCHVLSYQNGKVAYTIIGSTGTPSYIERGNLLLDSAGHQGCYYDTVYQLINGNWAVIYHAENYESYSPAYEITGQHYYTYFINKMEVSKETYDANLSCYFDQKKAIRLTEGTSVKYLDSALQ